MPIVDPKVEVEFTAGTWTDITADVDLTQGIAIKYGRTSEFTAAQTATCDFQIANHLGKYTPKAQLLADGTTAHPYYPNVVPRKRVRASNSSGMRFFGYIKSWAPALENGVRPYVSVSANDRQDQFSRIDLTTFYQQELALTSPYASYLLNDVQQSAGPVASFADSSGNGRPSLNQRGWTTLGATVWASGADSLPQPDGLTGVTVQNQGSNLSLVVAPANLTPDNCAWSAWVTVPVLKAGDPLAGSNALQVDLVDVLTGSFATAAPSDIQFDIEYGTGVTTLAALAGTALNGTLISSVVTGAVPDDGLPHFYALSVTTTGGSSALRLYVDGVQAGTTAVYTSGQLSPLRYFSMWGFPGSNAPLVVGPVAMWSTALASTVPAQLNSAGRGRAGDTSGQRVARLLQYVGLSSAEYSVDAGRETLGGGQSINGKTVLEACQDVAVTEGAGSTFYVNPAGLARFCDRTFRKPTTPNVTLSAQLDLDGAFAPAFDDLTLVNQSAVTRAGGSTLTYTDTVSLAQNGISTDSATSLASSDAAALNLAQQRVAAQSTPSVRVPQFTVDLLTSNVAASVFAGLQIGWRIRITGLPVGVNALPNLDVIVEGWTETITKTSWTLTFDASPADAPARGVWDDTKYGRWGPGATMTLTSGITAAATSISVTTTAGNPTFTLVAGAYPLPIKIGEEEMTITAAPVSSASPQTLTVTRGTSSTKAAAQVAGSQVLLSPSARWTL